MHPKILLLPSALFAVMLTAKTLPRFEVYFMPFEYDTLIGYTGETIKSTYDLSSLLKKQRKKLVDLVERQQEPVVAFTLNNVRLKVSEGTNVWLVDRSGRVVHGRECYILERKRFFALKAFLYESIPRPPEPRIED